MEFKCTLCDYKSDRKSNLKTHITNVCSKASIEYVNNIVKCESCEKIFTLKSNLIRHNKICKVKKNNLEEENKKLKEKVEMLETKLGGPKIVINNQTNNQQNILNINLTAYNDPNLKGMEQYYLTAIKKAFMSVPYIIEKIHFNINYPENQSMVIRNNRTKIAKVYDGEKWTTKNEDELIDEIINTYEQLLENYAEDDPEHMEHIERYHKIKERDTEEVVLKDLKGEVKKLMYDNRTMVKIKN